jgi:hypothetical protein
MGLRRPSHMNKNRPRRSILRGLSEIGYLPFAINLQKLTNPQILRKSFIMNKLR